MVNPRQYTRMHIERVHEWWRHTRGLDDIWRDLFGRKEKSRRVSTSITTVLPSFLPSFTRRGSIISLFFPSFFFPFYSQRCNPIQRTDFLPFFVFHRAELFYRSAITISLVVKRKNVVERPQMHNQITRSCRFNVPFPHASPSSQDYVN